MVETKRANSLGEISRGDAVEHPVHYAGDGKIECMAAMRSMMSAAEGKLSPQSSYWWGCAFKYLWRWILKGGVEDLRKCKQCVDYLIGEVDQSIQG